MEAEQSPCGDDEVYLSGNCMGCDILCIGSWEICPTPCLGGVPLREAFYGLSTYALTGDETNTKCCFWKKIRTIFPKLQLDMFLYLELLPVFQLRERVLGIYIVTRHKYGLSWGG